MVVLVPPGSLESSLAALDRQLDAALGLAPRALVLDMSAIARMSSTTIAQLLWARRRCSLVGIEVLLLNPTRQCREVLERIDLLRRPQAPRA
ncbi:STAS domain-containing protein [Nocardioides hankookensis]|uniref:STAS domain-containing protein n=1 Tax=Nocardioides hankookensis TaxID=443157 RepID=A0ABW1LJC4_9ACTN